MVSQRSRDNSAISRAEFGSDLVVELLTTLGIQQVALNPGSSFRGIHDSLVNFAVPGKPEMVLCCHEAIAVAVAHGYARVTGKPMAVAIHDVVGLQNASMAIYNAWCERVPMLVLGGTGPMATTNRRNHIDWAHTANVQGNLVRDFVKWDDQPASVESFPDSLLRGYRLSVTEPSAPVYLCFDADLQEQPISAPIVLPGMTRFKPPAPPAADPESLEKAARLLVDAEFPVILVDGLGRHPEAVKYLEELAETLTAPVISVGGRFNLSTEHPLNLSHRRRDVLGQADVVLALDVFDLTGALSPPIGPTPDEPEFLTAGAKLIHISLWDLLHHSLISDFERLHPVDVAITADTRSALPQLTALLRRLIAERPSSRSRLDARREAITSLRGSSRPFVPGPGWNAAPITQERLQAEVWQAIKTVPWTLVHGARGNGWQVTEPEQLCGAVGGSGGRGGGLGQSSGASAGSALALKDAGRVCVSITGDGDLLYAPASLWTAANLSLPLLTIVNNNRAYGNDEAHQEYMARQRGRSIENKGVGIYIEDPAVRFTRVAESFGVEAFGPVQDPNDLHDVLARAVAVVAREQRPVLVEVLTRRRND